MLFVAGVHALHENSVGRQEVGALAALLHSGEQSVQLHLADHALELAGAHLAAGEHGAAAQSKDDSAEGSALRLSAGTQFHAPAALLAHDAAHFRPEQDIGPVQRKSGLDGRSAFHAGEERSKLVQHAAEGGTALGKGNRDAEGGQRRRGGHTGRPGTDHEHPLAGRGAGFGGSGAFEAGKAHAHEVGGLSGHIGGILASGPDAGFADVGQFGAHAGGGTAQAGKGLSAARTLGAGGGHNGIGRPEGHAFQRLTAGRIVAEAIHGLKGHRRAKGGTQGFFLQRRSERAHAGTVKAVFHASPPTLSAERRRMAAAAAVATPWMTAPATSTGSAQKPQASVTGARGPAEAVGVWPGSGH